MHFVLDANEYIFAMGLSKKESCKSLLKHLVDSFPLYSVSICRTIIEEVRDNLSPKDFQNFINFANAFTKVDEDFLIPFEIGAKYEARGFKPADAFIAAYTEWVGADALVTENRHFLNQNPNLPFKVLTAEKCLSIISSI